MHDVPRACQFDQALRFLGRHRQGLLADHVLSGGDRIAGDREMRVVRRADMHCVDSRIVQQLAVVARRTGDSQQLPELGCEVGGLVRYRDDFGRGLPPDVFDVDAAHESGPDHRHLQLVHNCQDLRRSSGAMVSHRPVNECRRPARANSSVPRRLPGRHPAVAPGFGPSPGTLALDARRGYPRDSITPHD